MDRIDMTCLEQLLEKALLCQGDCKDIIEVVFVCLYFSLHITHPVPALFSPVSYIFSCLKSFFPLKAPLCTSPLLVSLLHPDP